MVVGRAVVIESSANRLLHDHSALALMLRGCDLYRVVRKNKSNDFRSSESLHEKR